MLETMLLPCRKMLVLLLATGLAGSALAQMPPLQALGETEIPAACGCRFGLRPGETLLFLSGAEAREAIIKENGKLVHLRVYNEKYLPEKRQPPKINDSMVVQVSNGTWNIQTAGSVTSSCAPRAKRCTGTYYRSKLMLQWEGRYKSELPGWGQCSC